MDHLTPAALWTALQEGTLDVEGQFVQGSNYTFLTRLTWQAEGLRVVYKPIRGERPLWDFPERSLAKREAAAYLVSEALGWGLVPPTLYRRRKLPLGPGSLQVFIPHDPERHYFTLSMAERQRLKPVALFDVLVNNADRKGSHILFDAEDHLWAIDQGLCFHVVPKLRTVIWDFAGQELPTDLLADVEKLAAALQPADSELRASLQPLLRPAEVNALLRRARALLNAPFFPQPNPRERPYPWPVV